MKGILLLFLFCIMCNAGEYKYNRYFVKYGKIYKIPPELLWAIAKTESNLNPLAINTNLNGTQDIGIMQINSSHKRELKSKNISLSDLYDPEINISIGSKILADCFKKFGFTYKGINCYNSGFKNLDNNNYNIKVLDNIRSNRAYNNIKKYVILK